MSPLGSTTPRQTARAFPGATASTDARIKAQLDMVDMDLEDELRKLQRRRVPPSLRRDYLKRLLFDARRKYKLELPDSAALLANTVYTIATRLASIEDVRLLLQSDTVAQPGTPSPPGTANSTPPLPSTAPTETRRRASGAERIIGRLVANARTKRRRARIPPKRCWFRMFAIIQRDAMLDYIQQCEREYASTNEAQRQADVVGPLVNTRRSAASKQGSVAMRRASRVIQAEALKAVTAQMMAQKAN